MKVKSQSNPFKTANPLSKLSQMKLCFNGYSPLVVHVVYRLAVGGLENGLVNLINHMPQSRYRHVIVCLTGSTAFRNRVKRRDVAIIELNKSAGHDFRTHRRFWQLMRQLRPDIVHTRNLATLEFQVTAAMAGVRGRVHGEHGRDIYDLDGTDFKYTLLRKAMRRFVSQYIAVSVDLAKWLMDTVAVHSDRVNQIYNGVDVVKFSPRTDSTRRIYPEGFALANAFVVGTIGRMEPVKDQLTLIRAFLRLLQDKPDVRQKMRLIIVGDGSLYQNAQELIRSAHAEDFIWLAGERENIADLLRSMDLFVLPSLREGISNTILEAMATGLPVVATNVGGNAELVEPGTTGELVPHSNPAIMADAIAHYFVDSRRTTEHGRNARLRVVRRFSMESMVGGYTQVYDRLFIRDPAQIFASSTK